MVNVEISLVGEDADVELLSLSRWLHEDDDLREVVISTRTRLDQTGDMGSIPEIIQAAFAPQGLMAALLGCVGTWVTVKRRAVKIRIRHLDKEVEIDASKMKNPEEFVLRVMRELGEDCER